MDAQFLKLTRKHKRNSRKHNQKLVNLLGITLSAL